jgi:hypothetical protein
MKTVSKVFRKTWDLISDQEDRLVSMGVFYQYEEHVLIQTLGPCWNAVFCDSVLQEIKKGLDK